MPMGGCDERENRTNRDGSPIWLVARSTSPAGGACASRHGSGPGRGAEGRGMILPEASALVIGGSRGLGFGLAEALVARGARVTITARSPEPLAEAEARLGAVMA